jgi:hypothetical protein
LKLELILIEIQYKKVINYIKQNKNIMAKKEKVLEYFGKFYQGGQVSNQLGQITKAAIEMANAFKKQGVISEIAGEQAIAQAFSNNQKEAQVFASFIKNVQTKKQAPTQEELQAVLELFTKLGIVK